MSAAEETLPLPAGFRAAGIHCGIKARRPDLALVCSDWPAAAAGMFTQIATRAAPVEINERKLGSGRAQAVLVNSGNANACTGERGFEDARAMSVAAAAALGIAEELVLATSTGVIGIPLPVERIVAAAPDVVAALGEDGMPAARAMMTTDAFPKTASATVALAGGEARLAGLAKGAGMVHPQMATMIAVLLTDAAVEGATLRSALRDAVGTTFNCISVDGDTSTSDSVFALANGASGLEEIGGPSEEYDVFAAALADVCGRLARMIVRDGEGARRVLEVRVSGARSDADARLVGNAVMTSLLVKTAFRGAQLNWGRVAAAAGRSGAEVDPRRLSIAIGDVEVVSGCVGLPEAYDRAQPLLEGEHVPLAIGLGLGAGSFTGWTSDLGEEYVAFNSGVLT